MKTLLITEKPSVGKAVAGQLPGKATRGDGYLEVGDFMVSWCFGHLLELAEPEDYDAKYKNWCRPDLPIMPSIWQMKIKDDAGAQKQVKIIKGLLAKCDVVINGGDHDREGQAIVDEVLEFLGNKKPVKRLLLSAIDDASIQRGLASIRDNREFAGLYASAIARARADWLVGMNLTRAYTIAGQASGHDEVFSVGRVQTPTLALVVRRDLEIENFVSRNYYVPLASFKHLNGLFNGVWDAPEGTVGFDEEGRLTDRAVAQAVAAQVMGQPGRIVAYETKAGRESAPLPFSLSALQAVCSAKWGMGAQTVLDVAQALYEKHKATSYPRTDCGYLPESQHDDAARILGALAPSFGFVAGSNAAIKSRAYDDKKITAHHGIVPTGVLPRDTTPAETKVFELIARHYAAQFYPEHEYQATTVAVECAGERFKASGRVPTVAGWKTIFEREPEEGAEPPKLPAMANQDSVVCSATNADPKQTKPPSRFTDGTLITAMTAVHKYVGDPEIKKRLKDTQGIGTDATRAGILETLLQRGYLQKAGKQFISTDVGRAFMQSLGDCQITDPGMTALFEQSLELIVGGSLDVERFLNFQLAWVKEQLVKAGETTIIGGDLNFGAVLDAPCPQCGQAVTEGKKTFECQRRCGFSLWKEVAGREMSGKEATQLLKTGKTAVLSGFKSKAGKSFKAGMTLGADFKVALAFEDNKPMKAA